jgi:hypothetical protein
VQIYPIGSFGRQPDDQELLAIANGTGGYRWLYSEARSTRASIEAAVSGFLEQLTRTLGSEVLVTVGMQEQTADAGGRITLNLSVAATNEAPLSDTISVD